MRIEAFLIGFVGSLHCVAMCGPLLAALHSIKSTRNHNFKIAYNFGRVSTYMILGLLGGIVGVATNLADVQNIFSIVLGAIIIMSSLAYFSNNYLNIRFITPVISKIKLLLSKYLNKEGSLSKYLFGVLNGLLPCGLVYMAVAMAMIQASLLRSVEFMLFFGLGTFPAMLFSMNLFIFFQRRLKIRYIIPIIVSLVGILLIVRGLNLGIPYLSPGTSEHMMH